MEPQVETNVSVADYDTMLNNIWADAYIEGQNALIDSIAQLLDSGYYTDREILTTILKMKN